jgi:hypothetical protein
MMEGGGGASELSVEAKLEDCREGDMDKDAREELETVVSSVEVRDVLSVSVSSSVWGRYSESVDDVSVRKRFQPAS